MMRMSKKMHLGFYLTSLSTCLVFGFVLAIAAGLQNFVWYQDRPGLFVQLSAILGILALVQFLFVNMVYNVLMLWKMWSSIQDGRVLTTPVKAIGFLLIPFFNIYWIFQAWGAFPREYNSFVDRHKLPVYHLSPGVYKAYPIITLLTLIPLAGILAAVVNMFVLIGIISKTCDAINALSLSRLAEPQLRVAPTPVDRSAVAV